MTKIILLIFTSIYFFSSSTFANDSVVSRLEEAISSKEIFLDQKINRISNLKKELSQINPANYSRQYELNLRLFHEYESFIYDSAFKYAIKVKLLAEQKKDPLEISKAKLNLGFVLLSSGLFKEAIDTLSGAQNKNNPDSFNSVLYATIARSYYDLADYNNDQFYSHIYRQTGNKYMDHAIRLNGQDNAQYWSYESLRRMKTEDFNGAKEAFEYQIQNYSLNEHQLAIATSSLGYIYTILGDQEKAISMLARAAISDLKASTKETVALRNLADIMYQQGDIKTAYRYIKLALEDATFYNARHRKIEISNILPIIEGEKLNTVEKQKSMLLIYSILASLLALIIIIFLIIIFRQLKKIKIAKQIIQDANQSLTDMNHKLLEANKIKEIYIGHFFNTNSEYIEKIEKLQRDINRKLTTNQLDDVKNIVRNIDLKKEREELFHNFDKTFLTLFPAFVEKFNKLFKEEDRIYLKDKELLNTDLRIFALIRMGIDDNEKIAKILEYSVNTIYTYKTKIKNKSIVPNEEFEAQIMAIKAV